MLNRGFANQLHRQRIGTSTQQEVLSGRFVRAQGKSYDGVSSDGYIALGIYSSDRDSEHSGEATGEISGFQYRLADGEAAGGHDGRRTRTGIDRHKPSGENVGA